MIKQIFLIFIYLLNSSLCATKIPGIDVSSYQHQIDWTKVASAGIKFAILRSTLKNGSLDKTFEYNYKNAIANGITVMAYHFSYATTTTKAISDAKNLISKLNGKKLPIYMDLEDREQGRLGKVRVTKIAKAFITTLQSKGYEANIYSNLNWYRHFFYPEELRALGCKFWIARYGKNLGNYDKSFKPNVGEVIWQYTSKGKVNGISTKVDLNMMYDESLLSPKLSKQTSRKKPTTTSTSSTKPKPTSTLTESEGGKMIEVICKSINKRDAPNGNIIGHYSKGDKINVIGKTEDNGWYIVSEGEYVTAKEKYVKELDGKVTEMTPKVGGKVTATTLRIREKPNANSKILGMLKSIGKIN